MTPEAKLLNTTIAAPSDMLSLRNPTSAGNSAPIPRPPL
jgi:hypothetical protein